MEKRVFFRQTALPYLLVGPQVAVTLVFFIWPAAQAIRQSMFRGDMFGLSETFVWFDNFVDLFADPLYLNAFGVTLVFSASVTALSLSFALVLAVKADGVIRGANAYKTLLIWPYAVAPVVAGVLWLLMFDPTIGIIARGLGTVGYTWNHRLDGGQALFLVILAAAWKQVSYNFIFFLAGLQAIPRSLVEAAAIDGAGPGKRFWTVVFPLLSPTTFFLVVVNVVYAFFETFGIIHAVTQGGPSQDTTILVYKVWKDGFEGNDLGGSAAQSVVLMVIVIVLTVAQFRYIERKVHY